MLRRFCGSQLHSPAISAVAGGARRALAARAPVPGGRKNKPGARRQHVPDPTGDAQQSRGDAQQSRGPSRPGPAAEGRDAANPRPRAQVARGDPEKRAQSVQFEVQRQRDVLQEQSRMTVDESGPRGGSKPVDGKFRKNWRTDPAHQVAYRFRMQDHERKMPGAKKPDAKEAKPEGEAGAEAGKPDRQMRLQQKDLPYSDFTGLRFPSLETAENFDYHQDKGLDAVTSERSFPIKLPGHRRLDPYLREYIHFLHALDPARFTMARIAERYRLRVNTVSKVIAEWNTNTYLTRTGLTKLTEKQTTREAVILDKKEQMYAKWVGWDQLGDEDDKDSDDEELGEFKGWRSTNDWVRRQNVEVESMTAFPMMAKRDPVPKRVDVDMVVDSKPHHKVINWIDPTDKVVF